MRTREYGAALSESPDHTDSGFEIAGHGLFDAVRGHVLVNPGMPVWWPAFCLTFDLGAAAALAWLLRPGHAGSTARA